MSILKKMLALAFVFNIIRILSACCNCEPPVIKHYQTLSATVVNLDHSGATPEVAQLTEVPKEAYGFRITVQRDLIAYTNPAVSNMMTSAFAFTCDCSPELLINPTDSILSIEIFTINNLNASTPAGSNVSENFSVLTYDSYVPLSDYLTYPHPQYSSYYEPNVLYSLAQLTRTIDVFLLPPYPDPGLHQFEITITMSDGREFELLTDEIELY